MSYAFHAAAPPGEWINDPNALFFAQGRYHLLVQHAADAPTFRRIGWGHLSSPDLMAWRWEGCVMPPEEGASIYSGSIAMTVPPQLFWTRHRDSGPWQTQHRSRLAPDLATAVPLPGSFGPAGRNARDPFVFRQGDAWRMLVARPCDWTQWRDDPPSTLELWGSRDLADWTRLAPIGPWCPPGVMWEVPVLMRFDGIDALILSLVDRRDDTATCSVRYWLGTRSDAGFDLRRDFPEDGIALDHGPDFYAGIPAMTEGWPTGERVVIGWASSWATARLIDWPERRGGGPIAMPRLLDVQGERLRMRPGIAWPPDRSLTLRDGELRVRRGEALLTLRVDGEALQVERVAPDLPPFLRRTTVPHAEDDTLQMFVDGPLVELFWRGAAITAVLPGDGLMTIEAIEGG